MSFMCPGFRIHQSSIGVSEKYSLIAQVTKHGACIGYGNVAITAESVQYRASQGQETFSLW